MNEIKDIIDKLKIFTKERDWEQFHNSKDLALAISIESAELLELFLWKANEEVNKEKLKDELADILSYCLLLSSKHNIDIVEIISNKISKNSLKYPVEKSKGNSKKYTDL